MGKIECGIDWSNGDNYTVIQVCEVSKDNVITVLKDLSLTPDETAALKRALNINEDSPSASHNKHMAATLERQIYEAIRGKCVSDAAAERAAYLALELAVKKFTPTNTGSQNLADTLSGALELCHDGNFDLGYKLINYVIGQLRASA